MTTWIIVLWLPLLFLTIGAVYASQENNFGKKIAELYSKLDVLDSRLNDVESKIEK